MMGDELLEAGKDTASSAYSAVLCDKDTKMDLRAGIRPSTKASSKDQQNNERSCSMTRFRSGDYLEQPKRLTMLHPSSSQT